jgi:hypothetical protein
MNTYIKRLNEDWTLQQLKDMLCDGEVLSKLDLTEAEVTNHYNDVVEAMKQVNTVATNWIEDHGCSNYFVDFLETNRGHENDCYIDTSLWSKDENFTGRELERAIESIIKYER